MSGMMAGDRPGARRTDGGMRVVKMDTRLSSKDRLLPQEAVAPKVSLSLDCFQQGGLLPTSVCAMHMKAGEVFTRVPVEV